MAWKWSDLLSLVKIWPIISHNLETVRDSTRFVLFANRKSRKGFPVSLKWTASWPKPPDGARKCKIAVFRQKVHFSCRKSATKFLFVKTINNIHWPIYQYKNGWWGCPLLYLKFWPKLTHPFRNDDFQSTYARSASAVQLHNGLSNEPMVNNVCCP